MSHEHRIEALLARMTLAQKVGQMTQPERMHITPEEVRDHHIGSVLSGGGSTPGENRPIVSRPTRNNIGKIRLFTVGVDAANLVPVELPLPLLVDVLLFFVLHCAHLLHLGLYANGRLVRVVV